MGQSVIQELKRIVEDSEVSCCLGIKRAGGRTGQRAITRAGTNTRLAEEPALALHPQLRNAQSSR